MTSTQPTEARERRAANRSKPGSAGERIEAIAFDLATGSRVVSPEEVTAAIADHRNEVLTEAWRLIGAEASSIHLVETREANGMFRAADLLRNARAALEG
jgi:hypothetical protein